MHQYDVSDVEKLLGLPRSTIRALVDAGFVKPARGARNALLFSFQDLIVLRTARALTQAKIPARRVKRALEDLRNHLPDTMPLSGLSICAVGERVVVRDGQARWQVDDGQYVLALDVNVDHGELRMVERKEPLPAPTQTQAPDVEDWFEHGLELEASDPRGAQSAYERAVRDDPTDAAAWINLGRLLHEQGRLEEAERVYRRGLDACGPDGVMYFNLGVVLEDLRQTQAALEAYKSAVGEDPSLADGHYNLARLYETFGKPQHAIRHLGQYRRLITNA